MKITHDTHLFTRDKNKEIKIKRNFVPLTLPVEGKNILEGRALGHCILFYVYVLYGKSKCAFKIHLRQLILERPKQGIPKRFAKRNLLK